MHIESSQTASEFKSLVKLKDQILTSLGTHSVSNTTGFAAHWKRENSYIKIVNASITPLYYNT